MQSVEASEDHACIPWGRNPTLANQTLGRRTLRVDVLLPDEVHEGDVAGQQLRQHLWGRSDFGHGCTWIAIVARPRALMEPSDLAGDLVVVISAKDLKIGLYQSHIWHIRTTGL
jgi:hypothetical protein